jgi:hypothetical protein
MNVNKNETLHTVLQGAPAIKEAVEILKTNKKSSKYYTVVSKYLNCILHKRHGSRPRGSGGSGVEALSDTTPAFVALKKPLRNMEEGVEHPLPP